MEEWKSRLIEEQAQLKERLLKLLEFMNSETFYNFDEGTKSVFSKQRLGMELYLNALNVRVYGDPKKCDSVSGNMMALLAFMYGNSWGLGSSQHSEADKLSDLLKDIHSEENES